MDETSLQKAIEILKQKNASLAYLIGSYATGKVTPMSDLDLAVLFNEKIPANKYGHRQIELIVDLGGLFNRSDVEIVILNLASPLMKFETINKGKLLYSESEEARVKFEVAVRKEFFDTQKLRDSLERSLRKKYGVP